MIILDGIASEVEIEKIKQYYINPIEMREKDLQAPLSLDENVEIEDVPTYEGFIDYSDELLNNFLHEHGMAMTLDDIKMIQAYFRKEETP